jgi:hypothetical protein
MLVVACFVGIPTCYTFPRIILVTRDFGGILESFMSCLVCQVWVLTMGVG